MSNHRAGDGPSAWARKSPGLLKMTQNARVLGMGVVGIEGVSQ